MLCFTRVVVFFLDFIKNLHLPMEVCSVDEFHLSCVVKQERVEDISIDIVFLAELMLCPQSQRAHSCVP